MPSSFGHCGESEQQRRVTAPVSKRAHSWAFSQHEKFNRGQICGAFSGKTKDHSPNGRRKAK
jgi:hypothetical protein